MQKVCIKKYVESCYQFPVAQNLIKAVLQLSVFNLALAFIDDSLGICSSMGHAVKAAFD